MPVQLLVLGAQLGEAPVYRGGSRAERVHRLLRDAADVEAVPAGLLHQRNALLSEFLRQDPRTERREAQLLGP